MSCSPRTHFALFQKYRWGTSSRAGPPCSASSGAPSKLNATHALPPVTSSSGRFVVYPPSEKAITYSAEVSTPSSSVSTATPSHTVSCLLHFVTQWMSLVIVWVGSLRNSSQVQFFSLSTSPVIENVQSVSGVRGVGPAERTGKSLTRYWPGGRRPACPWSLGRPWKAREMKVTIEAYAHVTSRRCLAG